MDWMELLSKIFEMCIIPLLTVLTTFVVQWLRARRDSLLIDNDATLGEKYEAKVLETVANCVIATNQTYTDALKAEGKFDAEAQKVAFNKTLNAVLTILTDDVKNYLSEAFGDLNVYLTQLIEANVKLQK